MNDKHSIGEIKPRIRPIVYLFVAFELVMLLQTSNNNLGTIVSGILCGLMVLANLYESRSIKTEASGMAIILYVVILSVVSAFTNSLSTKLVQLCVYVLLYVLFSSLKFNAREKKCIIRGFVFAGVMYSILIIYSRISNPYEYIHSRVVLFGSSLDPNYVGLPLVIAFSMLLYHVLNEHRNVLNILALFVISMAVLLTSSRGNFLSLALCVIVNVLYFLRNKESTWYKKILVFVTVLVFIFAFYGYASSNYNNFLQRIFSFSDGDASNGRLTLWREAFDLWNNSPIFGNGFESLAKTVGKGAHNTYIQLLSDTGIVGFILFMVFIINIMKRSYKTNTNLFIALLGLLCHSFFLGAITSRCFWVGLIMISMLSQNIEFASKPGLSNIRKTV